MEQLAGERGRAADFPVSGTWHDSFASAEDERTAALVQELEKLRPSYRQVIILRHLEGLSFAEIGKRLKRRPGGRANAVATRFERAESGLRSPQTEQTPLTQNLGGLCRVR